MGSHDTTLAMAAVVLVGSGTLLLARAGAVYRRSVHGSARTLHMGVASLVAVVGILGLLMLIALAASFSVPAPAHHLVH